MFVKLFEPFRIGNIKLRNRIKLPALATGYANGGHVTDRLIEFYRERARGGVGLIGITVSPTRLINPPFPSIYDDSFIPELKRVVEVCHSYGAKVYAQMGVGYAWCFNGKTIEVISPAGLAVTGKAETPFILGGPPRGSYSIRRELSVGEIQTMVETFGESARRATEAGFDAVEFIAGVGYVIGQFISPLTNRRADRYGGDLRGRLQFLLEIINGVKQKAGPDVTITCRVSGQFKDNGIPLDDMKQIVHLLEVAGVAAIDVIPGWHEDLVPVVHSSVPQGKWADLAAEIKQVAGIPIGAGSRIGEPSVAETVLAQGKADYVYMARSLIADPELPLKAAEGRLDQIRPCIACNLCIESLDQPGGMSCAVNPRVGKEKEFVIMKTAKPRKVLVIGAGPAGLTAGTVAALRGHRVHIYEKESQPGGQLIAASRPPHKAEMEKLRVFLVSEVKRAGVDMTMAKAANYDVAEQESPDVIIVACGASAEIPVIPGVDRENVATALDILLGRKVTDSQVTVIGGGLIGCETAEFLAMQGKKVTLLARRRLAHDIGRINRWHLIQRLKTMDVQLETGVDVKEILQQGVRAKREGKEVFFSAQSIVLAMGMVPVRKYVEAFPDKVLETHFIGDCVEARRLRDAIEEGFAVGLKI